MSEDDTLFEQIKKRGLNHPWIAAILVLGVVVICIGSFTDALSNIWEFSDKIRGSDSDDHAPVSESLDQSTTTVHFSEMARPPQSLSKPTLVSAPIDEQKINPQPEQAGVLDSALDPGDGKQYVREASASEVVEVMSRVSYFESDERFENLFKGRWIRNPGWEGEVFSEPDPNDFGDWKWSVGIIEQDSSTLFLAFTEDDIGWLRKGDKVRVMGRLERYTVRSPSVHDALIELLPNNK